MGIICRICSDDKEKDKGYSEKRLTVYLVKEKGFANKGIGKFVDEINELG